MNEEYTDLTVTENQPKEIKTGISRTRFFSIALIVIVSFLIGYRVGNEVNTTLTPGVVAGKYGDAPSGISQSVNFDLFWDVWDILQKDHISHPISETQLFYGAIGGLVDAVGDPYTQFFPPDKAAEFTEQLSGSFEGIGAEIGLKDGQLVVIAPLPDTPAEKAGIRAGDSILAIDGQETAGMSIEDAVFLIRGPKGTTVNLTIKGDGDSEVVGVVRDTIQIASITTETLTLPNQSVGTVRYIRISHFNEDTPSSFRQAVQKALEDNSQAIVLDLRNNPGGYLDAAVDITSYWIEDGVVVVEKRPGSDAYSHKAIGVASLASIPTIVLVNEGSASASEIVAGALQDYNLATVVGETTFGKGSVQELQMLPDGSAIKVTVTSWFTPNGRSIDEGGIQPDVEVLFDVSAAERGEDNILNKALQLLVE